ncbi:hypothetical protein N7454_000705 [Penicillium verhagenii]|nr:hypothetical protein N7454_000705 [Penicillium verhagenii]
MRVTRSFLASTLLLASVSATALDTRAKSTDEEESNITTVTKVNWHTVSACPATTALLSSPTSGLVDTSPGESGKSASSSGGESSGESSSSSSSSSDSGSGSATQYTTSTVYTTSAHTVTACPSSVKDCPASEKTTYVTTDTIIDYTTICPVTETATRTGAGGAAETGGAGPEKTITGAGGEEYTTSTAYTTSVHTVTACPASVTDCPASQKTTYVTTDTIIDYTTICPVTATATGSGAGPISTASALFQVLQEPPSTPSHQNHHRLPLRASTSGAVVSPSRSIKPTSSTPVIKTSASASPSASLEALALYVEPTQSKRKRQTYNTAVLIGGGSLTSSCADADRFYLTGGHIFDGNLLVSATQNASSVSFVGSIHPGSIRGTFSVNDGILSWSNPAFTNGEASFCVSGNTVRAILTGDVPTGCAPVTIAAVSYSELCSGGSASTSLSPISSSTPTPSSTALPKCSAKSDPELSTKVLPALDPSVDGSTLLNLSPSMYATLYYASSSGSTILQVTYYMLYPQVTLENAYKIATVTCSGNTLTVTVTSAAAFNIASQWPTNNFILITNSGSCNSASQRGVYMVHSYTTDKASLTITLDVTTKVWADVSDTMEVAYGAGRVNSTSISYTPSCTASYATTASSTPTPTPSSGSVSYENLTPEEKTIVAYLTKNNTYDDNGNIAVSVPAVTANITAPAYNPDSNSTQQAALEDALQNAGLPSPDSMWNKTASDLAGHCSDGVYVPATTVYTKRAPKSANTKRAPKSPNTKHAQKSHNRSHLTHPLSRHRRSMLLKRSGLDDESWWEYLWDGACSDLVEDIIDAFDEELGALAELICDLKDLYDDVSEAYANRNAIQCAWTGCYLDVVVATYWNFTYTASVEDTIPAQPLVESSVGTLSCVDCGLSISNLEFVGSVMIATSTGKVMSAFMTPSMSWTANLVMGLETTDAWSGEWTHNFDTINFDKSISVPGEFTITPSIAWGLGVQWSTTAAVDFTAGAAISVNDGTLYLDLANNVASEAANWSPTVEYTYPVFSASADVSFVPIVRTSLAIAVVVENANYGQQPIYVNSDTAIGFSASLVLDDGEYCDAGELELTSYSSTTNEVLFTGGSTTVLSQSGDVAGQTKCFNIPNEIPTTDEVNSLRSVGAAFCTSYLGYVPPTSVAYGVKTSTGVTTVQTTKPTTISTTSTLYEYPTVTTVFTQTTTVAATSYVTVSGSQSLGDSYMKKRALETGSPIKKRTAAPQPTKAPSIAKRTQVSEPALISTWDSSKISLACSQVATGTATTTFYTSTSTSYTGTVTNTVFSTVDALGALKTETFSRVVVSQTASTVTGAQAATATIAASCPLQTQVSCFTVTATGPDHVNGKQLYLSSNNSSPVWGGWGAGYEVGTFYLTCAGDLVALPSMDVLVSAQDRWVEFDSFSSATSKQTCSQDTSSGILSCGSGWYATTPVALRFTDFRAYSGDWQPVWNDGTNEDTLTPVVLTYDTVDCPCQY